MKKAPARTSVPWTAVVLAVLAVLAVISGVRAFVTYVVNSGGVPYHIDFDVYRAGGRAVLDDIPLYEGSFTVGSISLPFTYPPLSALAFAPLAVLPLSTGEVLFTLVSMVMLVLTVVIVLAASAREADRRIPRRTLWLLGVGLAALATWMWPVASTLDYGQINILLMLLVVADLLLPRTPWPRGALVGLAAALKLTPAVFGLYFLLRRQWREAATSLVSGLGFSALAWVFLPGDSHRYWTETVSDPTRIGGLMYSANQSWRGMVARFTGDPAQTRIWVVLAVLTFVAVVAVMIRQLAVGAVTAAVCTNSLLALLASPVSWAHHWVWVVPMALVAVASWWWGGRRGAVVLGAVIIVVTSRLVLHTWFPSTHDAEMDWSLAMKIFGSELVLIGAGWLAVGGLSPRTFLPALAPGRTRGKTQSR
ncbi:glycosyltransferase 87 family protein [uncultured Corynebacterium sp.]|uniref:glycosyltransferase 87 family protein n=1 Tax=uncultured Corynebacterium sp. TaxID=159447 RepID=UPI0025FF8B5D|nr:glycosyltransferase 87 family protein [uncultured Corynebacterium sp.]